jgi:integrase
MGLGAYPTVSLMQAREKAADARKLIADKIDPLAARDALRASQAVTASTITFSQCVDGFFNAHQAGWNARHAKIWKRSLEAHVTFGKLPVDKIDTAIVMKDLGPLWTKAPELAGRVRGRIEQVLDWARANNFRSGENPVRWGHLKHLLPAVRRVHQVEHFAALPYTEISTFMRELRAGWTGTASRALQFLILTACRTNEILGARWDEIQGSTWVIPPARTKTRVEHRVPLSPAALAILEHQAELRENEFVFPGHRRGTLTATVLPSLLVRRMGVNITAHGFRSTFKDWASELTDHPDWVSEKALGHLIGDETSRAYQRGDLLEKRRALMNDWAAYIEVLASAGAAAPRGATRDAA